MNFELTEQQILLQQTIRDFAQAEIAPGASERDKAARFPRELIPKMADLGLFGVMIPENYGGAGLDPLSFAIIIEEVARADASVALLLASHNSLCAGHILFVPGIFWPRVMKTKSAPIFLPSRAEKSWAHGL